MAKRMTETEKWKNPWYRKLPPRLKCLWGYILDSCDCAGIWKEDFELASFQIGESVTREDFDRAFEGRFVRLDSETVFIRPFVEFQYGKLKPGSKPHEAVVARLIKYGVELRPYLASPCQPALPEPFPNPLDTLPEPDPKGSRTLKDKEKEKEKDKVQETEKAQAKEKEQGTARASLVSGPDLDFDFAPPELVGHAIDRELGLEPPPPLPADPPARPSNVIAFRRPAGAPPAYPQMPPAACERRTIAPVRPRAAAAPPGLSAPPGDHRARGYFVASDYDGPPTVAPCDSIRRQLGMALRRPVTHERQEASA